MAEYSSKQRGLALLALLIAANLAAWIWAFCVFRHHAVMMSAALLAYGFGLRHAVDADHIAAIDAVTRKLMQQGKKPLGVGAFFSLGHSTIVILACLAIVLTSMAFRDRIDALHQYGGLIGTAVSALFLLAMGLLNLLILLGVWRQFRRITHPGADTDSLQMDDALPGGLMTRLFHRTFRLVTRSWHMYLVGFLFGLGFDTATEVGLLGISASAATHGLSLWSLMVFPALFTAGMALVDSLDNFVMVGAYGWAFSHPIRKLYYNMTITAASVAVALIIGGLEALGLIADSLQLQGGFWQMIGSLNDKMGNAGFWVIGGFILFWLLSLLNYRWRGYDRITLSAS
ncbi:MULTISPECIES: HoxN/HupN/NixA family nickel/cobalt transporter [Edwardsiella]|uniref:Nickel/cobalt efflux system n=2 Tax=Edwardsiella anguillarum TaxID=1821960 RepID=A0A076LGJ3_9GAMM|nr:MULTISPECIES: HoxN/HupN/NixA family nickel/cobalt transporter [Edwardsiella]AKM47150.1 nickel transporter [Edwardsiella sp. EA181011]GAJ67448.1 transition metal uptake transporter, Ni2+-Co2+ transporter family [Edwardsiella piscicida]AIJ07226.1 transition metal uptake transporter, Ni2+-Co2+ transporter (NiCoT) family [Edwardsiella anguillarum ET080813]AKR78569.1 HoxN/HupN/NixA family nickel/cobalt transporter [Edwardsiella sp. LADL05-105]KAB0590925.1 HoxN/HupN/NixA family nickel/cobalt tran